MRRAALLLAALAAAMAGVPAAHAGWAAPGNGGVTASADLVPAGSTPSTAVSGRNVTVSWAQRTFSDGQAVEGYVVRRYDGDGSLQAVAGACSGTVSGLSCTEPAVPPGTWTYAVVPAQRQWRGAESDRSAGVVVGAPALALSSTQVTTLPATVSGTIAQFVTGSTVTFRLDDPGTGTLLSGSITPDPVGSGGTADVTVTLPAGTAAGSHVVYAIGSAGDVASAPLTVGGTPTSVTTAAYDLSDASSGTPSNVSDPLAFAGDGRLHTTAGSPKTFDATRYRELDFNAPVASGAGVSAASFDLRITGSGNAACFYFEVRRASTGAVLATHGSPASPVGCSSGSGTSATSTPLPSVTTAAVANDLRIRIFDTNAKGTANSIDLAAATVTTGDGTVTLHQRRMSETLQTATTTPWSLVAGGDSSVLTSAAGWATSFSETRYLQLSFPAYVPGTATAVSASLDVAYRGVTSGTTACQFVEVYAGATKIGSHGDANVPQSCNATTAFVTDTIALPEVTTPSQANTLRVRVHMRSSGSSTARRRTEVDLGALKVTYLP